MVDRSLGLQNARHSLTDPTEQCVYVFVQSHVLCCADMYSCLCLCSHMCCVVQTCVMCFCVGVCVGATMCTFCLVVLNVCTCYTHNATIGRSIHVHVVATRSLLQRYTNSCDLIQCGALKRGVI